MPPLERYRYGEQACFRAFTEAETVTADVEGGGVMQEEVKNGGG